MIQTTQSEE